MLYNGEDVGNGEGPEVDVAVDPLEGTRLTARGAAERDRSDRRRRAGNDVLSGRGGLHGQDRRRRRARPASSTSTRRRRTTCRAAAKAKGVEPRRSPSSCSIGTATTELIAELRDVGAKVRLITDGDVAPSIAAAPAGERRRPADGHRRNAGGRDLRRGDQVPRRRDAGQAVAEKRRGAAGARGRGLRRRSGC